MLLLPGLFIAAQRCRLRLEIESRDRFVETVMDLDEIRRLSREEGVPVPQLLRKVSGLGISSVGIAEDTLDSLASEGRILLWSNYELDRALERHASLSAEIADFVPRQEPIPGSIWAYSRDLGLLDRIERHIAEKAGRLAVQRAGTHLLLIHRSGADFRGRFGLGFSSQALEQAYEANLGVVARPYNVPRLGSGTIHRLFQEFPSPERTSALLFADEEVLGHRGSLPTVVAELRRTRYRVGVVEFLDQAGMGELLAQLGSSAPVVRVHSIGRRELDENYTPDRAVARWRRAVRERRLKMLYVRCFFENRKHLSGDLLSSNLRYIENLVAGLRAEGFGIARSRTDRLTEPRREMPPLGGYAGLALGQSLLLGLALLIAVSRHRPFSPGLGLATIIVSTLLFIVLPKRLFLAVTGVAGAIGYATVGCIWAVTALEDRLTGRGRLHVLDAVRFFLRLVLPPVLGGILIAGLHSDFEYLLNFEQFRGIKISLLLPLAWIAVWAFRRYGTGCVSLLFRHPTWLELGIGALLLMGIVLYLVRSGNVTLVKPSATEDLIRTWFEDAFVARPRNKEFLIGWPAAVFFLLGRCGGFTAWLPVLLLMMQMGQTSILNTFCHFHSPLYLAFLRGFHGLWLGLSLGLIAGASLILLRLLYFALHKQNHGVLIGYFGFGNLGDELLWRVFTDHMRRRHPETRWYLLSQQKAAPADIMPGVTLLPRSDLFQVLERLAEARVVVVPGGGVLQSATSPFSLLYYVGLLLFARIFGARLLMPSQGFGPWAPPKPPFWPDLFAPLLAVVARLLCEYADHLSVRDVSAGRAFSGLAFPALSTTVTADLVFALHPQKQRLPAAITLDDPHRPLRIGVVLRGGHPVSGALLSLLQAFTLPGRPVQIIPISLRTGEDEELWHTTPHLPAPVCLKPEQPFSELLPTLDLLLSMRLHACIIAAQMRLPFIGVAIDPKIAQLAADAGMPCLDANTTITADILLQALQALAALPDPGAPLEALSAQRREQALATLDACAQLLS